MQHGVVVKVCLATTASDSGPVMAPQSLICAHQTSAAAAVAAASLPAPGLPCSWAQGLLGSVNDVSFSSDGRLLLGAGGDKRLLVWSTATGQVVHTLTGHTNAVSCVSCSPLDEAVAISAGEDRCLKV